MNIIISHIVNKMGQIKIENQIIVKEYWTLFANIKIEGQ